MTFLNPLVLFGLVAAAIPILIHLLNLRKLKVVEFSSLRFLKELQKTRMRRLKLRQWLILLLRTLLIILLVLTFSRPALKGSFASLGGGHATSTVVILLDDSPSMGTRNDRGLLFDQAREAAAQMLNTASASDEVFLFRLSDSTDPAIQALPIPPAAALKALAGMTATQRSVPYAPLVARGLRTLAASHSANKELFLITDGQRTQFSLADTGSLAGLPSSKDVGVFMMELSPSHRENGAVTSLTLESRLLSPERPMVFQGTITNFGDQQLDNTLTSLYLDGIRVAQQSVTIAPHASASVTMSATARRRGIMGASLHIDDDILDLDNRRHFVVNIPERIAVTCVGTTASDTRFVALALEASVDSVRAGIFSIQQLTRDRLQFADLSKQDVIILCNVRSLTPLEIERIAGTVKSGRSLVFFPGATTDYVQLNAGLFAALRIPPISPADLRQLEPAQRSFLSFSSVDYGHPVFEGMFVKSPSIRGSDPVVESPHIRTAAGLLAGTTGLPIITMSDGKPFLCEYTAGKGKLFVFAIDGGNEWSDFPFKGIYAPLMHRSMLYLSSPHDPVDTPRVGEPLRFVVRMTAEQSGKGYIVKSPSGSDERVQPHQLASFGLTAFDTEPSTETGIYKLFPVDGGASQRHPMAAVAVNSHAPESDLMEVEEDSLSAFWNRMGVSTDHRQRIADAGEVSRAVQESRYGVELWRYFILLALVCAFMEMVLGRAGTHDVKAEDYAHNSK
jgi:hypothetical protein